MSLNELQLSFEGSSWQREKRHRLISTNSPFIYQHIAFSSEMGIVQRYCEVDTWICALRNAFLLICSSREAVFTEACLSFSVSLVNCLETV